jgi:hypothetical protein
MGPAGWGAAAIISAMIEGLAGIHDDATGFSRATISPRFAAAGIDEARVCARYGPSGAYVAVAYDHDPQSRRIDLELAGVAEHAHLRVLLPAGASDARVVCPEGVKSQIETIEDSRYLAFDLNASLADLAAKVTIEYAE